jgi:hypothetical protein
MPDTKITALTALTAADPANDVLPIVDVSDTTMAASGTTKKISINNVLGAGGTATLASATISGNMTVDTNTLFVDAANNRVGIGTASPAAPLSIGSAISRYLLADGQTIGSSYAEVTTTGGNANYGVVNSAATLFTNALANASFFGSGNATPLQFITNSTSRYEISSTGVATWSNVGGVAGTAMTLNSTGLGVGGSAAARIHAIDSGGVCALFTRATAPAAPLSAITIQAPVSSGFSSNPVMNFWFQNAGISNPANECFAIRTSNADRLYVDAAGNVGIGVSTFGTSAAKVLSIGTGTEPTTGPAGSVQFFTSTRSANNTIPAIFTEGSGVTNAAITNTTVTNKIAIKVNGTIYYLLATTSAA